MTPFGVVAVFTVSSDGKLGELTVVVALAQSLDVHVVPGEGGLLPPVGSMDA